MDRADVIIFGGGMVGLALASALDWSGLSTIVIDPADPGQRTDAAFDGRTSAVSSSSMRMLEAIGVADHLAEPGCPIWPDRGRRRAASRAGSTSIPDDDEALGWMHENRHLRAALAGARRGRQEYWLLWKSRGREVDRGDHGVVVLRSKTAASFPRRC